MTVLQVGEARDFTTNARVWVHRRSVYHYTICNRAHERSSNGERMHYEWGNARIQHEYTWVHERSPNGINKVFDNRKRVSYSPAGENLDLGPGKTLSECSQSKGNRCVRGQKYPNFSCVCSRGHRRRVARPPPLPPVLPGAPYIECYKGFYLVYPYGRDSHSKEKIVPHPYPPIVVR